jgi:multidrug resistance protein
MKKKVFTFLFITIFIDFLSFGIIFPLLPYYAENFGASPLTIGLITGSFSLMQFIFSPIWGRISDKVGRKPIILISLLGTAISLAGFGLSRNIFWLFATRILAGFFTAASLPTTYAYVADYTNDKERAEKFGMLGAAWGLGFVFGPAFGGILSRHSMTTPFFAAAAIAFVNFIFAGIFLPASKKHKAQTQIQKEGLLNFSLVARHLKGEVGFLFILFLLAAFTLSNLEITFPLFAERKFQFNETNIGFFFILIGVTVGFTQGVLVGKVVKRFGEIKTVAIAHIFMIIGYSAIVLSPSIFLMALSAVLLACGIALNEPSLVALISKQSKEAYGTTLGATWSFDSLARMIGPAFGGYLFASVAPQMPFYANSLLLIFSLFVLNSYVASKRLKV